MRVEGAPLAVDPAVAAPERGASTGPRVDAPDRTTFTEALEAMVSEANRAGRAATVKADELARGASDDLHGTMIAAKEAELSLKLVGTVRNKLLDAFHELWRINV